MLDVPEIHPLMYGEVLSCVGHGTFSIARTARRVEREPFALGRGIIGVAAVIVRGWRWRGEVVRECA